jgi:flagellar basal-body rod protein FlgG
VRSGSPLQWLACEPPKAPLGFRGAGTELATWLTMFRSLNVAATGMAAQETQLDTIANNLANSNTTGYKRQTAQFEDLLYQNDRSAGPNASGVSAPTNTQLGTGVRIIATTRSFAQGTLQQTNNPLDLAIEGNGFLAVRRPTGDLAYTRAGSLQLDAQGRLSTSDGLPIDPPLTIPATATNITVAPDGTVSVTQPGSTTANSVGQLQLTTFPNPNGLASDGHNLYTPTSSSGEPLTGAPSADGRGSLMQGSIEGSNVDVVDEMVGMIRTQRAYEMNSKVISAADEMLRNATQNQ